MNIIIPIGGIGKRFKDDGFDLPKPLIPVLGNPMIYKVIENLDLDEKDTIHVIYNPELKNYRFESFLIKEFPKINFNFICLSGLTRGASETILFGLQNMEEKYLDSEFLIMDCDTFYEDNVIKKYKESGNKNNIFYFIDKEDNPIFSYIKFQKDSVVTEIKEKDKISNFANTGAYGFSNGHILKKYCEKIIGEDRELYVSLIYQKMIEDSIQINSTLVEKFNCVGTPLQLKVYCENEYKYEKSRICFDLDNTLVTFPKIKGDYTTVDPIQKNIDYLNFLKDKGNYIIIYTARRMKTHSGNVGKIISDVAKITIETLDKFGIRYDEIHFGKPHADFYIDDLAVSAFSSLDKKLGFYDTGIIPRSFNEIIYKDNTVIKNTNNCGELYFYNNIPEKISNMFPKIISASDNTIEMEKIKGINYSYLYVNGGLREIDIDLLLKTLNHIHSSEKPIKEENYHSNYGDKLKERYLNNIEIYNRIEGSKDLYHIILDRMEKYKSSGIQKIGVIHGDPVFTNVFLTETGIKYIDPRGKIGNNLSIFGDIYYDFSKVYQSILGYDFILNDIDFSFEYQEKIKLRFESNFTGVELRIIKDITASLLFTLMPLHSFSESRFSRYIKLIKTIL